MRPSFGLLLAPAVALVAPHASPRRAAPLYAAATDVNPRTFGLALELDDGTRKVHSVAENTQFVAGFFKGLGRRESFAQLTTSFYFVYEAMERALDLSLIHISEPTRP